MNLLPQSSAFEFSRIFLGSSTYTSSYSPPGISSLGDCAQWSHYSEKQACVAQDDLHTKIPDELPSVFRLGIIGRGNADVLWHYRTRALRDELRAAFEREAFTGLEFREIHLFKGMRCKEPVGGYVEMRVTGRVPVDMDKSGIPIIYECPICGYKRYGQWKKELGLHFEGEPEKWPDAFMMEQGLTLQNFVKPRLAQFIVDLGLRPVMLTRVEDVVPFEF